LVGDNLSIVDRVREPVRLAAGLTEQGNLDEPSQDRAIACLERFGQRLAHLAPDAVRAVGTNTLRKAKNGAAFLERAVAALGHAIDIIPGREEARLVYLGVSHSVAQTPGRRLVIDIGGGSTECIVGEKFDPILADSLFMGCVSYSRRFFPDGELTRSAFKAAHVAAALETQTIARRYRDLGWSGCVGASGTILAIEQIGRVSGWSDAGITPRALKKLRKSLLTAGHVGAIDLAGLERERAPVIAGGVAVLFALFDQLGIERMAIAGGALREGLLYDLIGRIRHEDVRDRTIGAMSERFTVDRAHAARVERTAIHLLRQVAKPWGLDFDVARRVLAWAAQLIDVGLAISFAGYHKHGAYLVANADMPGFSRQEKDLLSLLIRTHRRKIAAPLFSELRGWPIEFSVRLCALLRLAVLLNRSRGDEQLPEVILGVGGRDLAIEIYDGWIEQHPLTRADLEQEADYVRALDLNLSFASR
jgi:exopolyphosphatase/guanosine-5'-triphosphate,3'-diphosphate pyrophosphatase